MSRKKAEMMPLSLETKLYTREEVLEYCKSIVGDAHTSTKRASEYQPVSIKYYDIVASFDIETTSIWKRDEQGNPVAIGGTMYVWQFGIQGRVCIGRTWKELEEFLMKIAEIFETSYEKRLALYVHNLPFEFQWLSGLFDITDTFSLGMRKVVRAYMSQFGIELRCSYALSGDALKEVALMDYGDVVKQDGDDFDYSKLRGSSTPLTEEEKKYCIYDCLVVMGYVYECLKYEETNIAHLRMTKTGMVRNYLRKMTIYNPISGKSYRCKMKALTLEVDEYNMLHEAFAGGISHAACMMSGDIIKGVESWDISSSYPTTLCSEKFPSCKGFRSKRDDYTAEEVLGLEARNYGAVFKVEFTGLQSIFHYEHIISESNSDIKGDKFVDNGRVVSADYLCTFITNIDFENISKFYKWEKVKFSHMWLYEMDYLPSEIIYSVLKLYEAKTTLKGVIGSEYEYSSKKSMLNSVFGDFVMDIVRDVFEFSDSEWKLPEIANEKVKEISIEKYNNNKNRYNYYPWGVFCTSFSRRNLCSCILAQGPAYCYADTDSNKLIKEKVNRQFFEDYNRTIQEKVAACLKARNIDPELAKPKNKHGKECPLGVWEFEGDYESFKTLGAKRYIYSCEPTVKDGKFVYPNQIDKHGKEWHITVAGLAKEKGSEFFAHKSSPMREFKINAEVDEEHSGRITAHYFDNEVVGDFVDYLGNVQHYEEKKSVCFTPATFKMTPNTVYQAFLNVIAHQGFYK